MPKPRGIDPDPVGLQLGDTLGRTRVEGRRFTLRRRGPVDLGLLLEAVYRMAFNKRAPQGHPRPQCTWRSGPDKTLCAEI